MPKTRTWNLECWGGNFMRASMGVATEKEAYLESGKWKNCTHFILYKNGKAWTEWGKRA